MGVDIRKCINCGKLFNSMGSRICFECEEELDQMFNDIRDFLYQNPGADVMEISEQTKVPSRIILDFLRQGRLALEADSQMLTCERCGTGIKRGRYCEDCAGMLSNDLDRASGQMRDERAQRQQEEEERARRAIRMHVNLNKKK